jgi:hypothetical protein
MKTPRPFQESIETIARLLADPGDPGASLGVHIRTWVNSEADAAKLAAMENENPSTSRSPRIASDLIGRQYGVCYSVWDGEGRTLDECGEKLVEHALKAVADRAARCEKEAADLRARVRHVIETEGITIQ